jgi:hypothetical protein
MTDENALTHLSTHFVAARGDDTLRHVLTRLVQQGGQAWWFLVVAVGEPPRYRVARFSELRSLLEGQAAAAADRPLADLGAPLEAAHAVDPAMPLADAERLAAESASGAVIVVEAAWRPGQAPRVLGVVSVRETRSGLDLGAAPLADVLNSLPPPAPAPASKGEAAAPPQAVEGSAPPEEDDKEEREREIEVRIDGSVSAGGEVNVAGGDIVTNVYVTAEEKRTQPQDRRFEAAFPHEVDVAEEYRLWIAVLLPDAPSPFGADQQAKLLEDTADDAVPVAFDVDAATGKLKPVELDVTVTGDGFEIVGQAAKKLTVWPDGKLSKRWFLLRASRPGVQRALVEITQEGRLLQEFTVEATAVARRPAARGALNVSLKVATFNLSFSFSATGAA